jgi:hypothetical protein
MQEQIKRSDMPAKNYYKYLISAAMFIALLIAVDFIVGAILKKLYKNQQSGWDYRTRYSAEETKAATLIFGSSRAQQQYNPLYIEDSLNTTCYNVGRDGMQVPYHYAMLQAVLSRYTPKMIVLDCEYGMFKVADAGYERLSNLLPLYKDHPEMRPVLNLRSPFEKYKLLSNIYPYNSMIFKLLAGNFSKGKEHEDIKGYRVLTGKLTHPIKTYDLTNKYPLDTIKIKLFNDFINDCRSKNIKLYFVCPPYYMKIIGTDHSLDVVKKIAAEKNIPFIDYANDSVFQTNPALFDDTVHINYEGSKIFSAKLAHQLKQIQ